MGAMDLHACAASSLPKEPPPSSYGLLLTHLSCALGLHDVLIFAPRLCCRYSLGPISTPKMKCLTLLWYNTCSGRTLYLLGSSLPRVLYNLLLTSRDIQALYCNLTCFSGSHLGLLTMLANHDLRLTLTYEYSSSQLRLAQSKISLEKGCFVNACCWTQLCTWTLLSVLRS